MAIVETKPGEEETQERETEHIRTPTKAVTENHKPDQWF
jgi:hypothetical protein